MFLKGLHGWKGNEELAPETVTSCCQYKAVKMCLRLPRPWDWLTKLVLLLLTIDFKWRLFHLLFPFKTVMVHAFRLLSKTRKSRKMVYFIQQNPVPGVGMSNKIPKTTTSAVKSQCGCIPILYRLYILSHLQLRDVSWAISQGVMNLGPPWSAVMFLRTITVNINVNEVETAPVCDVDPLPAILQSSKYNSILKILFASFFYLPWQSSGHLKTWRSNPLKNLLWNDRWKHMVISVMHTDTAAYLSIPICQRSFHRYFLLPLWIWCPLTN